MLIGLCLSAYADGDANGRGIAVYNVVQMAMSDVEVSKWY
jgi:hypothetical protein